MRFRFRDWVITPENKAGVIMVCHARFDGEPEYDVEIAGSMQKNRYPEYRLRPLSAPEFDVGDSVWIEPEHAAATGVVRCRRFMKSQMDWFYTVRRSDGGSGTYSEKYLKMLPKYYPQNCEFTVNGDEIGDEITEIESLRAEVAREFAFIQPSLNELTAAEKHEFEQRTIQTALEVYRQHAREIRPYTIEVRWLRVPDWLKGSTATEEACKVTIHAERG